VADLDTAGSAFEHEAPDDTRLSKTGGATPRVGDGARLLRAVTRGYGGRTSARAVKLASAAVEAYNDWQFHALGDAERQRWLTRDLRRLSRSFRRGDAGEKARLERVVTRLSTGGDAAADNPILEAVAFARGIVTLGVLIADIDDTLHATLDRYARALGVLWELSHGLLSLPLANAVLGTALSRIDEVPTKAGQLAHEALSRLPASTESEALATFVDRARWSAVVGAPRARRRFGACDPCHVTPFAPAVPALASPWLARDAADAVDRDLAEIVATDSRSLGSALAFLQQQGGKRLRPALTLLAAAATGGDPMAAVRAASLVEWLHRSSLVVDDMLDEAPLRRGVPTLHTISSPPHAALVVAFILRRLALAAEHEREPVRECLYDAALTLADGERLELGGSEAHSVDRTAYMRIIEAKTARLFSCAAIVGGLACGATSAHMRALGSYGKHAGIAFQIVDDTLDYHGDERELGKRPGTDHAARKVTLPVLLLSETLACEPHAILDLSFEEARERMILGGVPQACLQVAREHLRLASAKLAPLPHPAALRAFATQLVERRA
jgi:geranylgeranyl pyrophosphate synthase